MDSARARAWAALSIGGLAAMIAVWHWVPRSDAGAPASAASVRDERPAQGGAALEPPSVPGAGPRPVLHPVRQPKIDGIPLTDGLCGSVDDGIDDQGNPLPSEERYDFRKINYKLRTYAELRRAAGLTQARTCNDARAFMRGYNAYLAANPAFIELPPPWEVDAPAEPIRSLRKR